MSHTVGVEDVGVLGRPWPGLNGRAIQELSTAQGGPAGKYEKAGGVWDPNVCVPKMARPDSPCFKFPSSHNGHFGLGGGGGGGAPLLRWGTAVMTYVHPLAKMGRIHVPSELAIVVRRLRQFAFHCTVILRALPQP